MKIYLSFIYILTFSWTQAQNVRIYGNIYDNEHYSTVILAPSVETKLLDLKIETNPKKGFFEFNITISSASFYKLYYKQKQIDLFLEPGANVHVSIENLKKENFVAFFEDNADENTILNQSASPKIGSGEQLKRFKEAALKGQKEFFKTIDDEVAKQDNELYRLAESINVSNGFLSLYSKNYIEMAGLLYKFYFPKFLNLDQDSFIVSNPSFLDIYSQLPVNIDYLQCNLYLENQKSYLKSRVNLKNKDFVLSNLKDDLQLYKMYIKEAQMISDHRLKEHLIESLIGEWILLYGRTTDLKEEVVNYMGTVWDEDKKLRLKKRLVNLAQYETGKPAPIFSFEDYSGNIRNLREYVGKFVYISVWSSKNPRSVQELKTGSDVYQKYKDREDIVFLYISIDDKKEDWEQAIRTNRFYYGTQAISFPFGYNSDFARKYSIQILPSFILIDKSGNLITNRAPKPSQPQKLIPLMDKVLGDVTED